MLHSKSRRSLALVLAAAVACVLAALAWSPSDASGWTPREGAVFNVPRSTPAKENRLEDQVVAAIAHAKSGSTIRMAMFSFDRHRVSQALVDAYHRGVNVQVIVNSHEFPGAQVQLYRALGQNRTSSSWYYQCRASCRGVGDVQHSKFVLFSQTGSASDVVMVGSLNMKENGTVNQFNDLLTLNHRVNVYDELAKVFDQMKQDRQPSHPFIDYAVSNFHLYVMPFPRGSAVTKSTEWTIARDPITQLLAPVKCTGADTDTGRTIVRVNMHAWSDSRGVALAREFRNLYAKGCDVKIQVGFASHSVRDVFAQSTSRGRVPVRSTGFDTNGDGEIDLYSHQKELEINGHYGSQKNKKLVVTGSSNYQAGGQYGDELIFVIDSAKIYGQYAANWRWSWDYHTHGFAVLNGGGLPPSSAGRPAAGRVHRGPTLYDGLGTNSPQWEND